MDDSVMIRTKNNDVGTHVRTTVTKSVDVMGLSIVKVEHVAKLMSAHLTAM